MEDDFPSRPWVRHPLDGSTYLRMASWNLDIMHFGSVIRHLSNHPLNPLTYGEPRIPIGLQLTKIKTLGYDARTYIGKLQEYLRYIQLESKLTVMIGHRPYRNGGNHMAFCPTDDSHVTGRKLLDTAYRLWGYTGLDKQLPGMYNHIATFWDSMSTLGRVSINVMEVREYILAHRKDDAMLVSRVDDIEDALFEDLLDVLEHGGALLIIGVQANNFPKEKCREDHSRGQRYRSMLCQTENVPIPKAMNVPWCISYDAMVIVRRWFEGCQDLYCKVMDKSEADNAQAASLRANRVALDRLVYELLGSPAKKVFVCRIPDRGGAGNPTFAWTSIQKPIGQKFGTPCAWTTRVKNP